ncbi:MAG: SdrD B-like domain-containing protein [Pirellulaceae bacterium]
MIRPAGLADYTIFVATDDGPFEVWLEHTVLTQSIYVGEPGRRYPSSVRLETTSATKSHPSLNPIRRFQRLARIEIEGLAWFDANQNGTRDTEETGVAGITTSLFEALPNGGRRLVGTTTSKSGGFFGFQDISGSSTYFLKFDPPVRPSFVVQNVGDDDAIDSDVDPASGETNHFRVENAERLDLDVGLTGFGTVSGNIWNDLDASEDRHSVEPGISSWIVFLDMNGDQQLSPGELSTMTSKRAASLSATCRSETTLCMFNRLLDGSGRLRQEC